MEEPSPLRVLEVDGLLLDDPVEELQGENDIKGVMDELTEEDLDWVLVWVGLERVKAGLEVGDEEGHREMEEL